MRQLKIIEQVTNRESLSMDKYLHEIAKIKLITAEEEVSLARRIHKGDLEARDCLINANLRFVISVAKQYQNLGLSLPDLINEGNLGLIEAAQRFDETRGFKFICYAVWWIRQGILYALAKQSRIVRLPMNRISLINKIRKIIADLEQKYEREPNILEITQALELTPTDVTVALKNAGRYISLDAPLVQGEEKNMYDVLLSEDISSPDKELLMDSLRKEIDRALNKLTSIEADIIRSFYGLNGKRTCSLEEIGGEFNLTRERIRQIKARAIYKLKYTTIGRVLKTYLD
ncbi:MAG: RNA polymerase subunit sigma [Bacteroidetes bacterium RBG_13_43_22]|nr:MAG: RNA polymerase subunit sigma [Bacteroidetes bacterium RBG_13_43_22]